MKILDVACGSKMFYFQKDHPNVIFMDIREHYEELESGHKINVAPDIVGDFRDIPFENNEFDLVVFDPPHLIKAGDNSWLVKKYGRLNADTWPQDIKQGFDECMRVLKPTGTLIFKWNEDQIKLREILNVIDEQPLFGNKRAKTHWLTFVRS